MIQSSSHHLQTNSNELKSSCLVVVGDVDFLFPDIDSLTIQSERLKKKEMRQHSNNTTHHNTI
jgi:hypothetical protein